MHSKHTITPLRPSQNANPRKPKNTTPLSLTNKPIKQNHFQLITTLLSSIKSSFKSPTSPNSNNSSLSIPLSTYDEFFSILHHLLSLTKQLSSFSSRTQTIDNILNTAKTTLTKEILSFFQSLPFNSLPEHIPSFSIELTSSFNICDNHINNFHLDIDEMELLNNKNIIEKIKEKINSQKYNKTIQVYKPKTKINNLKIINNNNYIIRKGYQRYKGNISSDECSSKRNLKLKRKGKPIVRSVTPLKLTKRKVSKVYATKSETKSKKNSEEKVVNLNGTFTNRKKIRKKTESFSSDVDYSLNDSCGSYTSDKMTKKFYAKYRIVMVGPKPTLYTNYLMNKSRDIIDHYHKEKQRKQKMDSYSFTDSYSHLFNIKRPQSTINRSKRYFSALFFGDK